MHIREGAELLADIYWQEANSVAPGQRAPHVWAVLEPSALGPAINVGGNIGAPENHLKIRAIFNALHASYPDYRRQLDVTLVEPKLGILNILGIPKAVLDPEFAAESFVSFERANVYWDTIRLQEDMPFDTKKVLRSENGDKPHVGVAAEELAYNPNLKLHFVQGHVTELLESVARVQIGKLDKGRLPERYRPTKPAEEVEIPYDSVIIASGRTRNWPLDPLSSTAEELKKEMADSTAQIKSARKTVIIGGGALGIELAGEIKHQFPEKEVVLVHPHATLPPESLLCDRFKQQVLEFLENLGVEVLLGTRIKSEQEDGVLVTTDGRTITSDLTFWCNYKKNNVDFLAKNHPNVFAPNGDILVTHQYEVKTDKNEVIGNIFAVGDLADLPLVKTAGWAYREGCQAGNNAVELVLNKDRGGYESVDKEFLDKGGMLLVVGMDQSVCEDFLGQIYINDPEHLKMYEDYRLSSMFPTYGLTKEESE
ncbi:hypothetical protein KL942_004368 [Ogataea angusta]|uniref:FAD/NAD(P)-binding domain-containing protein n=1 Tax=Pichia angusta TaxID=870730 RepID=A0ABQ7RU88_PICAN|nr:hypothetical protein KL942_004368 [Ogataea angusta]KAG7847589.1 hypothetical protein KL940_003501 [Ogataea angusta]